MAKSTILVPRVFLDLRETGETCSKHRVARLMREMGLRTNVSRDSQPVRHRAKRTVPSSLDTAPNTPSSCSVRSASRSAPDGMASAPPHHHWAIPLSVSCAAG